MESGLAQLFSGFLASLLGKVPFEGNGLLKVERLEITIFGVRFETIERLRGRIDRGLTVPFGFLQKTEIGALDPLIGRIVLFHGVVSPLSSHSSR